MMVFVVSYECEHLIAVRMQYGLPKTSDRVRMTHQGMQSVERRGTEPWD